MIEGRKDDQGKLRMDLVPVDVIHAMATVLTDGANRYGERNWEQGMAWSRPYAALLRHITDWWEGEDIDPDSGRPHLWHATCCIAFLTAYEERGKGTDDRPKLKGNCSYNDEEEYEDLDFYKQRLHELQYRNTELINHNRKLVQMIKG